MGQTLIRQFLIFIFAQQNIQTMLQIDTHQMVTYDFTAKEASVEIQVINSLEKVAKDVPAALLKEIKNTFKKESNHIFTQYGENTKIHAIFAEKKASCQDIEKENLRQFAATVYNKVSKLDADARLDLQALSSDFQFAFLEAFALASYQFLAYKKKNAEPMLLKVMVSANLDANQEKLLHSILTGVPATRNLVNEPPCAKDAVKFADLCVRMGNEFGFDVEVLQKKKIESLKMGGILGVNKGSSIPPTLTIMEYKPKNAVNTKPLVLVGKGVMFDTGGYSLKTGNYMAGMKADMAGASTVLGTMIALGKSELPYHVVGIVPATDNKISSDAIVVDDVLTMHNGKTVEVGNTDAEGRLILADALSYASKFKPELVIDIATLTGAAAAITGPFGTAMVGNNEKAAKDLLAAGKQTHELLVALPYWSEFDDLLKSDIADMKNIGGPIGGATTAGKFLEKFTDYPWIHLDIAGPSFLDKPITYKPVGGSGVGVRLLLQYITNKIDA